MIRVLLFAAAVVAADLNFTDWDGLQTCFPKAIISCSTEQDIMEVISRASTQNLAVKVVGAGHSFSSIAMTDSTRPSLLLKIYDYAGIVKVDKDKMEVEVKGGTRLRDLNDMLESQHGLALVNMGATAAQTVSGATATGTHGTGRNFGSMSTLITGIRLILSDSSILKLSENDSDPALFKAARVSLGSMGVISTLTLKVVESFKMRLSIISIPVDELLSKHDELYSKYERFQWGFVPYTNVATMLIREETTDAITDGGCWEPTTPTKVSPCVDTSYKTLVDSLERYDNRTIYTEMEMFVDVKDIKNAIVDFMDFQEKVKSRHEDSRGTLFTNIRYVKGDDILLSPMRNKDSAVISMIVTGDHEHTGSSEEFSMYAQGLEELTARKYKAIPHWGKQNWAKTEDLRKVFGGEELGEFESMRKGLDPSDMFLNEYLRERLM